MSSRPLDADLAARLGARLLLLRKNKGWSANDVQAMIGLGKSGAVRSYERGTHVPSLQVAILLANLFGVRLDDLVAPLEPPP